METLMETVYNLPNMKIIVYSLADHIAKKQRDIVRQLDKLSAIAKSQGM